jgi:pyruvate/2-oxoglutarate dehydrogenase complex dihydrolipoamide acyltransferase (E2) component
MHNLCFALGSVIKKPWVCEGRIEIREIMHMTVIFDHDVVDGAPAMRFMVDLIQTIEEGAVENGTAGSSPV